MYLSDRDLASAIQRGHLIVNPPAKIDPTSIDLSLDHVDQAQVWDIRRMAEDQAVLGDGESILKLGKFKYPAFAEKYLIAPPNKDDAPDAKVIRDGRTVFVRPGGFLLWPTKEEVGTPKDGARLICFVDGKSTRARTGIVVHMTAPTIHGGWFGKITLEIGNFGPFTFALEAGDVIAQLIVAQLTSVPAKTHEQAGSLTQGRQDVAGRPAPKRSRKPREPKK